ncbi:MAG: DUF1593 domain-containing protein [Treponema sp.]|jgi:hypothetical protein|nr:DUF1593 domain-containing protein [Treponema sp.]
MILGLTGCPTSTGDDDRPNYSAQHGQSPRTIITTDPEGDDKNSMIHALLYANDMNIVGLVYSASRWHTRGDSTHPALRWSTKSEDYREEGFGEVMRLDSDRQYWHIDRAVEAYAQVYDNLNVHDSDYPSPDYLRSIIKIGNIDVAGDISKDSEGARYIADMLNGLYDQNTAETEGKIYIQVWGGLNTAARALKDVEDAHSGSADWAERKKTIIDNTVFLSYADQEGSSVVPGGMGQPSNLIWAGSSYDNYVKDTWTYTDDNGVHAITWRDCQGMWGYGCTGAIVAEDAYLITPHYNKAYIKDIGPLGELYWFRGDYTFIAGILDLLQGESGGWVSPVTQADMDRINGYINELPENEISIPSGWGGGVSLPLAIPTNFQTPYSYASEGDSTAFATMIDNGLRNWEDPTWGGWGGRQTEYPSLPGFWTNTTSAESTFQPAPSAPPPPVGGWGTPADQRSMSRWFGWAWRDFLNRMQWTVNSRYSRANHEPVVNIKEGIDLTAQAGQMVTLTMDAYDPDGDSLTLSWWEYPEADTYGGIGATDAVGAGISGFGDSIVFTVPADAQPGETIHVIAQVKDSAPDPFTCMRWQRVVITVVE